MYASTKFTMGTNIMENMKIPAKDKIFGII